MPHARHATETNYRHIPDIVPGRAGDGCSQEATFACSRVFRALLWYEMRVARLCAGGLAQVLKWDPKDTGKMTPADLTKRLTQLLGASPSSAEIEELASEVLKGVPGSKTDDPLPVKRVAKVCADYGQKAKEKVRRRSLRPSVAAAPAKSITRSYAETAMTRP